MNKRICFIVVSLLGLMFFSCDDIFVKDISKENVKIVAPSDRDALKNNTVTFVWETLENADDYHVIIVSPSFDHVQTYVCDSITKAYRLPLTLPSGDYEWTIQARNYAYQSLKQRSSFKIVKP